MPPRAWRQAPEPAYVGAAIPGNRRLAPADRGILGKTTPPIKFPPPGDGEARYISWAEEAVSKEGLQCRDACTPCPNRLQRAR